MRETVVSPEEKEEKEDHTLAPVIPTVKTKVIREPLVV